MFWILSSCIQTLPIGDLRSISYTYQGDDLVVEARLGVTTSTFIVVRKTVSNVTDYV